jgi:WD40 repeat protein
VRLWSPADQTELAAVQVHRNTIYGVTFSPDGGLLATAGFDRTIRVWALD